MPYRNQSVVFEGGSGEKAFGQDIKSLHPKFVRFCSKEQFRK